MSFQEERTKTTLFEYSREPLNIFMLVIFLFFCLEVPMNKISTFLGICYGYIHKMVKKAMCALEESKLPLSGVIEIDETYVNAGMKGRNHKGKLGREPRKRGLIRRGRGTWDTDKPPILVLRERGGEIRVRVMKNMQKETIRPVIEGLVEKDSEVHTDEYGSYGFLDERYNHETVNHGKGEYARGKVHVNGCEGYNSLLKPWLGRFRGVAKKNLHLYVKIFEFITNEKDAVRRFMRLIEFLRIHFSAIKLIAIPSFHRCGKNPLVMAVCHPQNYE